MPHAPWKAATFVAAMRLDGIVAPFAVDGPINGPIFRIYVERPLIPRLRPGDIVILDNLGSHEGAEVRRPIEEQGASLRFPPPCSPDLNPIELAFAQLKARLRKAAARSVDDLWDRIGRRPDAFGPKECQSSLRHAGYASA